MIRLILRLLAAAFLLLGSWVMFDDITNDDSASIILGEYMRENAPSFLLQAEVVVDRYIDPCSLIIALGCSPFIWHPVISSLLLWPAAIVFLVIVLLRYFYMKDVKTLLGAHDQMREGHLFIAKVTHRLVYFSLIMLPTTGLLIAGMLAADIPGMQAAIALHEFSAFLSYVTIALHVGASLYSRYKGEGIWNAMVPVFKEKALTQGGSSIFRDPNFNDDESNVKFVFEYLSFKNLPPVTCPGIFAFTNSV